MKAVKILDDRIPLEDTQSIASESTESDEAETFALFFTRFVTRFLKQRECRTFVPDKKDDSMSEDARCGCGRPWKWHQARNIYPCTEAGVMWKSEDHTRLVPVDTFGDIEFSGFGSRTTTSPFVRIDSGTDPRTIWTLMTEVWHLPKPSMVISVTGGAKRFQMKNRLSKAFRQGLINVARSTGAWIITGGTRAGVMQYVGEAVHEYSSYANKGQNGSMVAIGIASWGIVDNSECLTPQGQGFQGRFPVLYELNKCKMLAKNSAPLDHNHTHFLLVDDGSAFQYGKEIKFRANLENFIGANSHTTVSACGESLNTPVVLLLCEGGDNSLKQVEEAVKLTTPVVVIHGSGRAADVIYMACKKAKSFLQESKTEWKEPSEVPERFRMSLESVVIEKFELDMQRDRDRKVKDKCIESLCEIVCKPKYVTLFDMEEHQDLDKAILHALMKANSNTKSQVNLALTWNRTDVARDEIFTHDNRRNWQEVNLDDEMKYALTHDSDEFVQLFLDTGVHLAHFLTIDCLKELYFECLRAEDCMGIIVEHLLRRIHIYHTMTCFSSKNNNKVTTLTTKDAMLNDIGHVYLYLMKEEISHLYSEAKYQPHTVSGPNPPANTQPYFAHPERDLFLWALLFNRSKVARLLWHSAPDPIGGALFASRLLQSLAKEAEWQEEIDLSLQLQKEATFYEKEACEVLIECHTMNKIKSHDLLTRNLVTWGGTTVFSLAANGEMMTFMQLSCCQAKLNKIWIGNMADYTSEWKIVLAIFMPIFLPIIKFKSQDVKDDATTSLETSQNQRNIAVFRKRSVAPYVSSNTQGSAVIKVDEKSGLEPRKKSLFEVSFGLHHRAKAHTLNILAAVYFFYTAPVTKFFLNVVTHMAYLALYTFVILAELPPIYQLRGTTIAEFVCWTWSFSLLVEELRQLLLTDVRSVFFKLQHYFKSFWNFVDFLVNMLWIMATAWRLRNVPEEQSWARIAYSFMVMLLYLRFMAHFYVSKSIGPKIIMIQKMLKDLSFFLYILVVFILSFGVPMQALLYPSLPFSFGLLVQAIYMPYWQVFGELYLDKIEGKADDTCTANLTLLALDSDLTPCPEKTHLVPLLCAVYTLLTSVLLMSLLVAMFSYTFQVVQDNSEKVWRFYRFHMVFESYHRPSLVPPFILLSHLKRSLRWLYKKCAMKKTMKKKVSQNSFRVLPNKQMGAELSLFEKSGLDAYECRSSRWTREQLEARVAETSDNLEKVIMSLEEMRGQIGQTSKDSAFPLEIEKKLDSMDSKTERQRKYVKKILHIINHEQTSKHDEVQSNASA